jgi:hypothetical protein
MPLEGPGHHLARLQHLADGGADAVELAHVAELTPELGERPPEVLGVDLKLALGRL